MKLTQLFKAKSKDNQHLMDSLWNRLGNRPKIAWYPSSGNDYRDIMELKTERALEHGIEEQPDLFIHTDYNPSWVNMTNPLYEDGRTSVRFKYAIDLQLDPSIEYRVPPSLPFNKDAYKTPHAKYLRVEVCSRRLGKIEADLIYCFFENRNFLFEVLLKHKINISHLVNVREGIGFGGGDGTALLNEHQDLMMQLHPKYVLTNEGRFSSMEFHYTDQGLIEDWSSLDVKVYTT